MTIGGYWKYFETNVGYGEILAKVFKGKLIAIDVFAVLFYPLRCAVKKIYLSKINPFTDEIDEDEIDVKWFKRIIRYLIDCMFEGFIPLLVFDGPKPKLKEQTIKDRHKVEKEAVKALKKLKKEYEDEDADEIDRNVIETARKHMMKINNVPLESRNKVIDMIKRLGIPWIISTGESERTCALLNRDGVIPAAITPDSDFMAFGGEFQLLSKCEIKDGIFGRMGYKTAQSKDILAKLDMDRSLFLEVCIMAGTDFNKNIKGISWVGAVKYMKMYGSISAFGKEEGKDIKCLNHRQVRKEFALVPWTETASEYKLELTADEDAERLIAQKYGISDLIDEFIKRRNKILTN